MLESLRAHVLDHDSLLTVAVLRL